MRNYWPSVVKGLAIAVICASSASAQVNKSNLTGVVQDSSGAERLNKSNANPQTVDEWFDVKQFVVREPVTLRRLATRQADLRAPGIKKKWDFTAMKAFRIREGVDLKFRAEFYNAFNTTHLGAPNRTVTSSNFGRITGTLLGPREIRLAMRLVF